MRIGVDLMSVSRFSRVANHHRYPQVLFTETELTQARALGPERYEERLAGRFCVKEATCKLLGRGFGQGLRWRDIEVTSDRWGAPAVVLHGGARQLADEAGVGEIVVSLTHQVDLVVAVAAAALTRPAPPRRDERSGGYDRHGTQERHDPHDLNDLNGHVDPGRPGPHAPHGLPRRLDLPDPPDPHDPHDPHDKERAMEQTVTETEETRLDEIAAMAADLFSVSTEEVVAAESFLDDLGTDSLLAIELLTHLEKRYDIRIAESESSRMTSLRGTYEVVAEAAGW
ncbi:4'-phosphopantetheinyl transferase superfamily protein [Actinacidiphila sp. ITFR-21]|uniref:4'-phosphopantetheinyl transferase superfamily protein n=1 Tax=Actinacidiphila sp. ITFR-21 TaxID=3075199 RepID=UPI00288A8D6D|nr:4'-phosphopantetheinyl transferase superfamily protein [Streptomyces sp. ITFR-21]WNI18963.1 4'-phosphopantetheinyl transferase superfamily protein [Streptomyces sp. ITFR-21]